MKLTRLIYLLIFSCILLASTAFAGNYQMIDTEYGQLEYVEFSGDNDGAIIFLHGNPSRKESQNGIIADDGREYATMKKLHADTGKTVIALARPGFGNSYGKRAKGNVTVETCKRKHVDAVVEGINNLISTKGLSNVTMLGFSAGSRIGATYSLRHPEHLKRVVLYDGTYDVKLWQALKGKKKKTQTDTMKILKKIDTPNSVEYVLMYGEKSKMVNPKVTKRFYERLTEKGFNVTIIGVPGVKHMDFFITTTYDVYLAQITK